MTIRKVLPFTSANYDEVTRRRLLRARLSVESIAYRSCAAIQARAPRLQRIANLLGSIGDRLADRRDAQDDRVWIEDLAHAVNDTKKAGH